MDSVDMPWNNQADLQDLSYSNVRRLVKRTDFRATEEKANIKRCLECTDQCRDADDLGKVARHKQDEHYLEKHVCRHLAIRVSAPRNDLRK